jgi:hypothetical protein
MPQISLAEGIRYLFPGVIIYLFLLLWPPVPELSNAFSIMGMNFLLALLIISVVLYFLYRVAVYNPIITRLHDLSRRNRHNYRTYLKDRFDDLSHQETIDIFTDLRDTHFSANYVTMTVQASAVHFLYMTCLIALAFEVVALCSGGSYKLLVVYGAASLLSALLGAVLDAGYENREYGFVSGLSDATLRSAYDKIRTQRRS